MVCIKLKISASIEGNVEEIKCYAHIAINAATTATAQAKCIKVRLGSLAWELISLFISYICSSHISQVN